MLCVHFSGQDNISLRNKQWEYVATVWTCYIGKNGLPINAQWCRERETPSHVWVCHGEEADKAWWEPLRKLQKWMEDYQTDQEVAEAILNGLQNWRAGTTDRMTYSWQVWNAVSQQEELGWQPFLEEWLCLESAALQQAYLNLLDSRRTGKWWVTELIKKLWKIAWDLWEHRNGSLHENINRVSTTIQQNLKSKVRENFIGRHVCSIIHQTCTFLLHPYLNCYYGQRNTRQPG